VRLTLGSSSRIAITTVAIMRTDLELCLTLADLAETMYRIGNRDHAEQTLAKAEMVTFTDNVRAFGGRRVRWP
jgi:hypothetical protein